MQLHSLTHAKVPTSQLPAALDSFQSAKLQPLTVFNQGTKINARMQQGRLVQTISHNKQSLVLVSRKWWLVESELSVAVS